ncbi:MAG: hypothetical protein R3D46_17295 [Defluviimonas denitrificans]|jgi:hypothetical protein
MTMPAKELARLEVLARLMRDRDLAVVAKSLQRLQVADRGIEELGRNAERAATGMSEDSDGRDMLQLQAYSGLVEQQRRTLTAERNEVAARVETDLASARHSFARWRVIGSLEEKARQAERDAKRR